PRGGIVSSGPPGMPTSGGTFTGPVCFDDNVEWQLGTACGDVAFYYDGSDLYTLLQDASASGGWMIALEDSPPAPDTECIAVWRGNTGGATTFPGTAGLCLEDDTNLYIHTMVPAANFGGIVYGDPIAATQGGFLYGLSGNATDPDQFRFFADGGTRFLDMGVGVQQLKQTTTYSVITPDSDAAPGELTVRSADSWSGASVNTTGGDILVKGGLGTFGVTIDDWNNCAGDTVTVQITVGS
ncbi:unnamed protein product, partial [marine sediment metagenome]